MSRLLYAAGAAVLLAVTSAVPVVPCPPNSTFAAGNGLTTRDRCDCNIGYASSTGAPIVFNNATNAWTGACNAVACPINSQSTVRSGIAGCACNVGYAPTTPITWNQATGSWSGGACRAVACPNNAQAIVVNGSPACVCKIGYAATIPITWSAATGTWTGGSCNQVACPTNALPATPNGTLSCICKAYYIASPGPISWVSSTRKWANGCIVSPCPRASTASNPPGQCNCQTGYRRVNITYNSSYRKWSGYCAWQSVPANSVYNPTTQKATCNPYFSGTITWSPTLNGGSWVGKCTKVTCPSNSVAVTGTSVCACKPGYPGTVAWNPTSATYTGSCGTRLACPANSAYNTNGNCVCNAGMVGHISWTTSPSRKWTGACSCENIRKEWRTLTAAEKALYFEAVGLLSSSSRYTSTLRPHYDTSIMTQSTNQYAHQSAGVFPWHRWYLFSFENALRSLGAKFTCLSVPYYDWSVDGNGFMTSQTFRDFGGSFSGCLRTLGGRTFGYSCVTRSPGNRGTVPTSSTIYNAITQSSSLSQLYSSFIGGHNTVHNNVGGNMAQMTSSLDPFFMMHHGFVDYVWYLWSICRNNYSNNGLGTSPTWNVAPSAMARPSKGMNGGRGYTYRLSDAARAQGFVSRCPNIKAINPAGGASSMGELPGSMTCAGCPEDAGDCICQDISAGGAASISRPTYLGGYGGASLKAYHQALRAGSSYTAAVLAGCMASQSTFTYSGVTSFASSMCAGVAEFDSYLQNPCVQWPTTLNKTTERQRLAVADAACWKRMYSTISG